MEDDSPYRSPQAPLDPWQDDRLQDAHRPGAVTWFYVYCVFMALLYLGCLFVGLFLAQLDPAELDAGEEAEVIRIQAYAIMAVSVPLMVAFGIAPFLGRRRWLWIYGIVMIGLGMTSCCTLPFCIPLLIFWIKPETKAYFNEQ